MDLKKVSSFESMVAPEKAGGVKAPVNSPSGQTAGTPAGPSFQETLSKLTNPATGLAQAKTNPVAAGMGEAAQGVKFSNHAVERMQTRGISFDKADLERLNEAVGRAANKGSKDTLVLMNDSALIVSVKNKTVVTVMDKTALKENVFTNIDSTIVM